MAISSFSLVDQKVRTNPFCEIMAIENAELVNEKVRTNSVCNVMQALIEQRESFSIEVLSCRFNTIVLS